MNDDSIAVIALSGELEIGRKGEIRDALALPQFSKALLVDCSDVSYADSTALAELMRLRAEADTRDVSVAILIGNPQFARLLRFAGLEHAFAVFDSRAAALSYLGSRGAT